MSMHPNTGLSVNQVFYVNYLSTLSEIILFNLLVLITYFVVSNTVLSRV